MNKFIFWSGIVFFIGSIVLISNNYYKLNVERRGSIVKVKIESLPLKCRGSKNRYFVSYSYQGKIYSKSMRGGYCSRHHVGEIVEMKVLEGSSVILFPNESIVLSLVSFLLLGLFGLGASLYIRKR